MRIGIDVGGTNTDAVLMDGSTVAAAVKRSTSQDVTSGIVAALAGLREQRDFASPEVDGVMIGTTHFINALIEARGLAPTAAVRLGLPATASLPPFTDWPAHLVGAVHARPFLAHGGHEFDGRVISDLDPDELKRHAEAIAADGIRSVAISSVFSPINDEFEQRAQEILAAELGPDVAFSLSSEIGRIGLLERENATIINAALRELADGMLRLLGDLGIVARLKMGRSATSTTDAFFLTISGADQVEDALFLLPSGEQAEVRAALARQAKRIAPTGYRRLGKGAAWVRVSATTRRRQSRGLPAVRHPVSARALVPRRKRHRPLSVMPRLDRGIDPPEGRRPQYGLPGQAQCWITRDVVSP